MTTFSASRFVAPLLLTLAVTACGGGGGGSSSGGSGNNSGGNGGQTPPPPPPTPTYTVNSGSAVKGPLASASVSLYTFDSAATSGQGQLIIESSTNAQAQLQAFTLEGDLQDYYLVEFNSTADTIDLTTGESPVFTTLKVLVPGSAIANGEAIYASILTTLTVESVLADTSDDAIEDKLSRAKQLVASVFDFGVNPDGGVFDTPPLLTADQTDADAQLQSARARYVVEAAAATVYDLYQQLSANGFTADQILSAVGRDLADGNLDAMSFEMNLEEYTADALPPVFNTDVTSKPIPGSDALRVSDTLQAFIDERDALGLGQLDTTPLAAELIEPRITVSSLTTDADNDGQPNAADEDDDNDGIRDSDDDFPRNPEESRDTDRDGIGNNADEDDDNDQTLDEDDDFPLDPSEQTDTDADGEGDNADFDDDNDGVADFDDAFPLDADESEDFDGDRVGDNRDNDDDNDGKSDVGDGIDVVGHKNRYQAQEMISLRIRGKNPQGERIYPDAGWHVQYYTFDTRNEDTYLTSYTDEGLYNASYSTLDDEWIVEFPAPRYAGTFFTRVSLYCSRGFSSECGEGQYEGEDFRFTYHVSCPGDTCEGAIVDEPGVNISDSANPSEALAAVTRPSGQLVALYNELIDVDRVNFIASSSNQGANWNTAEISFGYGAAALASNENGRLHVFQRCDNELCVFQENTAGPWNRYAMFSLGNFDGCRLGCDINEYVPRSILIDASNNIVVTYTGGVYPDTAIYVSRSRDFLSWTRPVKISDGDTTHVESSIVQDSQGNYLVAYSSYADGAIIVKTSTDLNEWVEVERFSTSTSAHMSVSLILVDGGARLFFGSERLLYSSFYDSESAEFSALEVVDDDIPFGAYPVNLIDGGLGYIYIRDINEQRDVFFEAWNP